MRIKDCTIVSTLLFLHLYFSLSIFAQEPLSRYDVVSNIENTERFLLCQQGDSLSYIYDKTTQQSFPTKFNSCHKYYNSLTYLGIRKNEPIFYDGNFELFGLNDFYAGIIGATDRGRVGIDGIDPDNNELCLRDGASNFVWLKLDDIPKGHKLSSIFDKNDMVEDRFDLYPPEELDDPDYADPGIYFIMRMPKLSYPKHIRKHILYWIADCCAEINGEDYICNITDKTSEKDIIDHIKRETIHDNFSGTADDIEWGSFRPSGEGYGVTRILNTKDYASFIIDWSTHIGGGTGFGISYGTTFDLKNNRRLTLSDFVEEGAFPTIDRILAKQHYGYDYYDSDYEYAFPDIKLHQTTVVLGWDGLVFHYGRYTISGGKTESYIVPYDSISQWLKIRPQFEENENSYKVKFTFEPIKEKDKPKTYWTEDLAQRFPINWRIDLNNCMKNDEILNDGYNRNYAKKLRDTNPQKAITIYRKLIEEKGEINLFNVSQLPENNLYYSYSSLASEYFNNGLYAEAKKECNYIITNTSADSYNSTEESYSPYIDALKLLAKIAYLQKEKKETTDYAKQTIKILLPYLQNEMPQLRREKRNDLWEHYRNWITSDLIKIAYWTQDDTLRTSAYNALLYGKGVLLNTELAMIKHIKENGTDEDRQNLKEYLEIKETIDYLRKTGKTSDIQDEEKELKEIENKLLSDITFSNYIHLQNINTEEIIKNLNTDEIAIEFIDVQENEDTIYYALLLQANYNVPIIIRLCSLKDLRTPTPDDLVNGKLYQLIWNPLEKYLIDKKNIFFSPSGILYTLPLEYAKKVATDKRINECYTIYRFSSTREIAHARNSIIKKKKETGNIGLLVGGLNYDAQVQKNIDKNSNNFSLLRGGIRFGKWCALPATQQEVQDIMPFLNKLENIKNVEVLIGNDGTETKFREEAENELNVLHIATHGFYLSDKDFESLENNDYRKRIGKEYRDIEEKGLIRSGLIFAGINQALKLKNPQLYTDDGIMTALEISTMNLSRTDLAVLSACQTAQGEITNDGVIGLQRGFKKAGVGSILMSLWKVDDKATCLFMTKFYECLSQNHTKQQALNEAQRFLINETKYNSPHYWAAFILLDAIK